MDFVDFILQPFMLRGDCGCWDTSMKYVYIFSNLAVMTSYLSICLIFVFTTTFESKKIHFRPASGNDLVTYRLFALTFLWCGAGHLENITTFFYAAYHLWAIYYFILAIIGWATFFSFLRNRFSILGRL